MSKVEIYGASDDLIEIDGDIREEFNPTDGEMGYLGFSDGTILGIIYSREGIWRITLIVEGMATYELKQGTDSEDNYTDRATLTLGDDIEWVLFGDQYAKS